MSIQAHAAAGRAWDQWLCSLFAVLGKSPTLCDHGMCGVWSTLFSRFSRLSGTAHC